MKKIFLPMLFFIGILYAGDTTQRKIEIGIDEKIGQMIPLNLEFFDEKGYQVALKDIIKKPMILNFVYFRCPGICSPILTELTTIVNHLDLTIGKDYQIVTVSFDEREKPELAQAKKMNYLTLVKKQIPDDSWKFLTGDSATIRALTDAAGFMFKREGNDFLHAGAIIAVSPEGKIARYLYGTQYLPFDVKMAIMEASENRSGPTIARLLAYCYTYSPEGRQYVFNVTRVSGAVILFFAVVFVVYISVKPKKNKS